MKKLKQKFLNPKSNLVSYADLETFPFGIREEVIPGIFGERLPFKDGIFIRSEIEKGVYVPIHYHNFFEEITVYSGAITELISNTRIDRYGSIKIPRNKEHIIFAEEDSVLYAYIYKPKN